MNICTPRVITFTNWVSGHDPYRAYMCANLRRAFAHTYRRKRGLFPVKSPVKQSNIKVYKPELATSSLTINMTECNLKVWITWSIHVALIDVNEGPTVGSFTPSLMWRSCRSWSERSLVTPISVAHLCDIAGRRKTKISHSLYAKGRPGVVIG